jgi:phage terminase large subunit-like protein
MRNIKERALGLVMQRLDDVTRERLAAVDGRLLEYIQDVGLNIDDTHNAYEVLGALKFLRLFRAYEFDARKVLHAMRVYEGEWKDGVHVPGSGGMKFAGLKGRQFYQLQPFQVFVLAVLLGPQNVTPSASLGEMGEMGGMGADVRRLCTDLVLFMTRKSGKTLLSAFIQTLGFFFWDANFEGYCCANSADQSKILFETTKALIHQLDPNEKRIRFTATEVNWKVGQPRSAKIAALSAGGKTKDGLFPQLCSADEYGSAEFVKNHCDMLDLVNVVQSGMGPRREPLTVTTTTAGYAVNGPFYLKLESIKKELRKEVELGADERTGTDWQSSLIFEPDDWEKTDEDALLSQENIWRKANPMIGVSVMPDFYRQSIAKARLDSNEKKEVITKLLNVFQNNVTKEWILPSEIKELQRPIRVDDLSSDDGWVVFCGMDYSLGDDLHATTYLCVNTETGEFFADMDGWMTEKAIKESSIRTLLELWVQQGWLHVSPGATLQPNMPIDRIIQLSEKLEFVRFGYDTYKAKEPVNTLKAWIYSLGMEPKDYVMPVKQNFATYNPAVLELDYMIRNDPPLITFSENPMWPWEFGNCVLETSNDGMENRKPLKRNAGSDGCKVDHVQGLCTCLVLYDLVNGN